MIKPQSRSSSKKQKMIAYFSLIKIENPEMLITKKHQLTLLMIDISKKMLKELRKQEKKEKESRNLLKGEFS